MKVGKFPEPIQVEPHDMTPLPFGTAAKLATWAEEQLLAWAEVKQPSIAGWETLLRQQVDFFKALLDQANLYRERLETDTVEGQSRHFESLKNEISGVLTNIRRGRILTTDTPLFAQIKAVSQLAPNAAALLYLSQRTDGSTHIQNAQQHGGHFYQALIQLAGLHQTADDNPALHARELQSLKAQLRKDSETFDGSIKDWRERYEAFKADARKDNDDRATAWQEEITAVRSDWQALKNVYDEQLALQAPTQYWADRQKTTRNVSIWFGVAFALVSAIALLLFVIYGLEYLGQVADLRDVSVLVVALPVLVPSFMAIWFLRILGRLFSENLQLSVDASERQTMVKTFLALMHDEQRGKGLVTDSDRILILHSLFRPSSISSKDDAPPVNWFDILSQKLGGTKK